MILRSGPFAIYIFETTSDGRVSGFYMSRLRGRNVIHTFANCTLSWVTDQAELVLGPDPTIYRLQAG